MHRFRNIDERNAEWDTALNYRSNCNRGRFGHDVMASALYYPKGEICCLQPVLQCRLMRCEWKEHVSLVIFAHTSQIHLSCVSTLCVLHLGAMTDVYWRMAMAPLEWHPESHALLKDVSSACVHTSQTLWQVEHWHLLCTITSSLGNDHKCGEQRSLNKNWNEEQRMNEFNLNNTQGR